MYFGSIDRTLYALRPDSSLKWTYRSSAGIYSAPTIDSQGKVIFGTWSGELLSLDSKNGSVDWVRAVGATIYTSPTVAADGSIYVLDSVGNLVKFSGPVHTPEPSSIFVLIIGLAGLLRVALKYNRR